MADDTKPSKLRCAVLPDGRFAIELDEHTVTLSRTKAFGLAHWLLARTSDRPGRHRGVYEIEGE
jgi:hypothetical protein